MTKKRHSRLFVMVAIMAVAAAMPAFAQEAAAKKDDPATSELESLRAQLAARQGINEQLLRRIESLERQLAAQTQTAGPALPALDVNSPKPPADSVRGDVVTAIEEALVSKGLVLIPAGSVRGTPSITWAHSGTGTNRADSYATGLMLETGLPWGMAASISVPYIWRDFASGNNHGIGDPSISISKKIANESEVLPAVLLRLSYTHDGGKDPFVLPAIGSGFRSIGIALSGIKRFDPLAVYGSLSYAHAYPKYATIRVKDTGVVLFQGGISPGDSYAINMGISLAATPEIALDAGLSFAFANSTRLDVLNTSYFPGRATVGYFNLGASFLLTRRLSISIAASAGVTKDASDVAFSVALPYRF